MKNKSYKLSRLAQAHLLEIKAYTIENYSGNQWIKYKSVLLSGFQVLADNPDLGKHCENVHSDGLYFPIGKHVVYYTKEDSFILVFAVLGQSQLPQNHIK